MKQSEINKDVCGLKTLVLEMLHGFASSDHCRTLHGLLNTIGNEITPEALSRLKILLRGHVDKELLDQVQSGSDLLYTLNKRGLITDKRLAFLRKLLTETKSFQLVIYLDSYRDKNCSRPGTVGEGRLETSRHRNGKERRLQAIIERIENEIKIHESNETNCKDAIEELENEIMRSRGSIASFEEEIVKLKCNLKKEHNSSQSVEKRLDGMKYLIQNLSRDAESLMAKLENTDQKKSIQDELVSKHAEIKGNQLAEGELLKKYEFIITNIRAYNDNFRRQASEMMAVEAKLQEDTTRLRNLKKGLAKNKASSVQLRETLLNVTQELEQLKYSDSAPLALYTGRGQSADTRASTAVMASLGDCYFEASSSTPVSLHQIVDHNEFIETTAPTVIGRKGKKSNPVNFMFPCSVAVDLNGNIYVADSRNHRVQILRMDGTPARKPIEFGKFRPSALAVSKNGKCFISDSYVVRVYSSNGELLHHILPIYGKTDLRPSITCVAVDDDVVLIVDAANKRIQKFRQDGIFLNFVGGNHVFHSPFGVTVSRNGDVIVSESEAHQIKIFDGENGPLKKQLGTKGLGYGKFCHPRGVVVDNHNNLIVADSSNHQIQVLSLNDDEEGLFGSLGTAPGFFDTPYDVTLTSDGTKIVVVETKNHRVQVFKRRVQHTHQNFAQTDSLSPFTEQLSADKIDNDIHVLDVDAT